MTYQEWLDGGEDVWDVPTDHRPLPRFGITDPADPRLVDLSVGAEFMTVDHTAIADMRQGCRTPNDMRAPDAPIESCNDSFIVSGVPVVYDNQQFSALFVSWQDEAGLEEFTKWSALQGGSCRTMTNWESFDVDGKRMPNVKGRTGVIFAPDPEVQHLIGGGGALCPGCRGQHTLTKAFDKPRRGRTRRAPAFVLNQFIAIPSDLAGCPTVLRGPRVRTLYGLKRNCPGNGIYHA